MENENIVSPAAPADSAPATNEQPSTSAATDTPQGEAQPQPAAPQDTEAKPRARGAQQRIEQLVWQRQEAERRAADYEARLAAVERERVQTQQRQELASQAPDIRNFNDLQSYLAAEREYTAKVAETQAMAKWESRMEEMAVRQAQMNERAQAQYQQVAKENSVLSERYQSGIKKYPDFVEKVNNPELPSIRGTPAYYAILESDKFEDISYALANNPNELDRLGMIADPIRATREIAKLEAKFSGPAVTSAPPPPPSRTGSTASGPKDWSQMSTAEHIRTYREQKSRKRFG